MAEKIWQFELEEYILQGESDKAQKSKIWQTAIGLQAVDSLKTSAFLLDTAIEHIEGNITIYEAQARIQSYYGQKANRTKAEDKTREADIVSVRIAKLLSEDAFEFSAAELKSIHRRLFEGVFENAGAYRQYNVTKKEWVLKGATVKYADFDSIENTVDRILATERQHSYEGQPVETSIKHLAIFIAELWQTHPFFEGNTRAAAVFLIKYMKTLGLDFKYDAFREYSWFFRNSLVRANYNDPQNNVRATRKYLEMFFENLLLGTNHKLKNRYIHIDHSDDGPSGISAAAFTGNKFDSLNCSIEELEVLKAIVKNPKIRKRKIAYNTGRSAKTVKKCLKSLTDKKYIVKKKGILFGKWKTKI